MFSFIRDKLNKINFSSDIELLLSEDRIFAFIEHATFNAL